MRRKMKERITITVDKKLLKELDKGVNDFTFANRSHALEFLVAREKEHEKG